jgi:phosphoglycolate phosphatase
MKGKYRHFIFDFDGVICDSLSDAISCFNEVREEHFPILPSVAGREDMTMVYAGALKSCLGQWLSPEQNKEFFDKHSRKMETRANRLRAFTGITDVLTKCGHQGFSIVTSAYSEAVRTILRREGSFDESGLFTISGRELAMSKSQKIKDILTALELPATEAIYVGDLESDILYCNEVPIDIIAVGYGYHPYEYLREKKPTFAVASVEELGQLIEELR